MLLYGRMGSPFVRRTAILLDRLGIGFEIEPIAAIADQTELRRTSPVGRVPALRIGDRVLVDSLAIALTLLEEHDPEGAHFPRHGPELAEAHQRLALSNGATEKFVAAYYEQGRRPPEKIYQDWIDLCHAQSRSALDALDARLGDGPPDPVRFGYVETVIATGLQFMETQAPGFFEPERHPRLASLHRTLEASDAFRRRPAA
ncbi:MAG: glutathione S-transferase family protein [Rhodobacteraceae bacterium]|nr:glutathione S-transferase family protein [Paracoccaceae bacterium]